MLGQWILNKVSQKYVHWNLSFTVIEQICYNKECKTKGQQTFQSQKKEYLRAKFDELETKIKTKNIRDFYKDIRDFQNCYQSRTNILKNEKGDLVADCHNILVRWREHFSQLLNDNDVRLTETYTSKSLVCEPSALEFEMVIRKIKRHKSPGIGQIPAKLIKAGDRIISSEIHNLIKLQAPCVLCIGQAFRYSPENAF